MTEDDEFIAEQNEVVQKVLGASEVDICLLVYLLNRMKGDARWYINEARSEIFRSLTDRRTNTDTEDDIKELMRLAAKYKIEGLPKTLEKTKKQIQNNLMCIKEKINKIDELYKKLAEFSYEMVKETKEGDGSDQ